jgi:hypothetical protein
MAVSKTTINATCSDGGFVEQDDVNGKTAQVEWDAEESVMVVTYSTRGVTALRVFLVRARVDVSHCVVFIGKPPEFIIHQCAVE